MIDQTEPITLEAAFQLFQRGKLLEAARSFEHLLKTDPDNFDALHYLGIVKASLGDLSEAKRLIERSLANARSYVPYMENYVTVLFQAAQFELAEQLSSRAVKERGPTETLLYISAISAFKLGRLETALDRFDKLLQLSPRHFVAHNEKASVLAELRLYQNALAHIDKALEINPRYPQALLNKGNVFGCLGNLDEALRAYERALTISADIPDIYLGYGNVLHRIGRNYEALAAYEKALGLEPNLENAWLGRGNVFADLKRYDEAFAAYHKALSIKPDLEAAEGARLYAKMNLCDWQNLDEEIDSLAGSVRAGKANSFPFALLAMTDSPDLQLRCAQAWMASRYRETPKAGVSRSGHSHDKIRIGYVSADFRAHPVGYLTAGLFECHDANRFETYAFSIGPSDNTDLRRRLEKSFHAFFDLSKGSDADISSAIKSSEIDILVDLNGHTQGARTSVFADRPAPIAVNYLGFAGTLGSECWDYIVVDETVVSENSGIYFPEKRACLPCCFMPHDEAGRSISEEKSHRTDHGLPDDGFVFCCFNNVYKINPHVFESWMRILGNVNGSVLWLSDVQPAAKDNLREQAKKAGIDQDRLVFAKRLASSADHLARHRFADLFLDTLPYNAHTTASDALWAGLPVLTQIGEAFAGRVAASLLNAIGLQELITHSHEEYEALAIKLALDRKALASIKEKLARNRRATPLFDTPLYTKHLEAAFEAMYRRHKAGLPPDHIRVEP